MCVFVFVGECFHVKLVWAKWFGYIIYQDQLEKLNLLEKLYKTMEILAEWLLLCLIISVSLVRYSLSQDKRINRDYFAGIGKVNSNESVEVIFVRRILFSFSKCWLSPGAVRPND